jgi:hypothetical protein
MNGTIQMTDEQDIDLNEEARQISNDLAAVRQYDPTDAEVALLLSVRHGRAVRVGRYGWRFNQPS